MTDSAVLLEQLVRIESPTYSAGVLQVADRLAAEYVRRGAVVQCFEGGHLQADLPGFGPPILLLGHSDTVWPVGTLARMPFRVQGGWAYGPGVWDMKSGLVMMLDAIDRARTTRQVRVFLSADEEKSSRTARGHIRRAAEHVCAAFVLEPPSEAGELKTARKAVGRFELVVAGIAAHSGTSIGDGASAVVELAHQVLRLHAMTDTLPGLSVNVGVVEGGTAENVVAASARARIDVRASSVGDMAEVDASLANLRPVLARTSIEPTGGWTKPPLVRTVESTRLFEQAQAHGAALGRTVSQTTTGGGSDGNLLGALGIPVLDGMGPRGAGAHADHEGIDLASMSQNTDLLARLLAEPGA